MRSSLWQQAAVTQQLRMLLAHLACLFVLTAGEPLLLASAACVCLLFLQDLEPEVRTFNTAIIACNMCGQPQEALKVSKAAYSSINSCCECSAAVQPSSRAQGRALCPRKRTPWLTDM
jgi:hypothetical protein